MSTVKLRQSNLTFGKNPKTSSSVKPPLKRHQPSSSVSSDEHETSMTDIQQQPGCYLTTSDFAAFKVEIQNEIRQAITESLKDSMSVFVKELADLRSENEDLKQEVISLKTNMSTLQDAISTLTIETNHNNQYSRKSHLRLLGIPEPANRQGENCIGAVVDIVNRFMPQEHNITNDDIEVAHRLRQSPAHQDKPRPMIVRFNSRKKRDALLVNRRVLKGKSLVIMEDLSPGNRTLLYNLKKHIGVKDAWAHNGKIWAQRSRDDRKMQVGLLDDLDDKFGP